MFGMIIIILFFDWEEVYNFVKEMCINGLVVNVVVDIMGCECFVDFFFIVKDCCFYIFVVLMFFF